nr:hypothetical protein [uncultured Flavobacterium sp.]
MNYKTELIDIKVVHTPFIRIKFKTQGFKYALAVAAASFLRNEMKEKDKA